MQKYYVKANDERELETTRENNTAALIKNSR